MLCRVEMPTNEQIFGRFYRYQFLHATAEQGGGKSSLFFSIVLLVIAGIAYFSGMIIWVPVVLIVLAVGFPLYLMYIKPGMLFKKKAGVALQTEVYLFTDTGFTRSVRSEEGGLPDNASVRYDGLLKVVETGNDFYFYTAPTQAYWVDKEFFTNGSPQELHDLLEKVMGKKFISGK